MKDVRTAGKASRQKVESPIVGKPAVSDDLEGASEIDVFSSLPPKQQAFMAAYVSLPPKQQAFVLAYIANKSSHELEAIETQYRARTPKQEANRLQVAYGEYGARVGENHHNAWIPNALVEQMRDMHEFEGQSYGQIAARLGISMSTVKKICTYQRRAARPVAFHAPANEGKCQGLGA